MSGVTMTQDELLFSSYQAATTSVPTAAAVAITLGMPVIKIPANYFVNVGERSSSLKLEMGGLLTATATIPTWQFGLYAAVLASPPVFATTLTLGLTAAFTPAQAATNFWWDAIIHIGLRTMLPGQASTVAAVGKFKSSAFLPATYSTTQSNEYPMPAQGAFSPLTTYDTSQVYSLWPGLVLGAATAGNTVTVQYCKLYGEN
jgi:hypothetical protein